MPVTAHIDQNDVRTYLYIEPSPSKREMVYDLTGVERVNRTVAGILDKENCAHVTNVKCHVSNQEWTAEDFLKIFLERKV